MSDYTIIPDTDCDADSPVDEDLILDLKENIEHLYEHEVRGGTYATGIRLVVARGIVIDSGSTGSGDTGWLTEAITFSSDSVDGNPNFGSIPQVFISIEESSAYLEWGSNYQIWYHIVEDSVSTSGFSVAWRLGNVTASSTAGVVIRWFAVGTPNTGE